MSEHGEVSVADTEAVRTLDDARVAVLEAENTSRVLGKLLELREALVALKGPLGNIPAFRNRLQDLLSSDEAREQLLKELDLIKPAE